ncbi:choice-of-anchor J domain-containing protein [Chryseobacterium daecheongense]|uniref:T9SS-dependent choice-of-anchor J family protein n=1 Tax=Chryseobacterium daecheongense TaxID=192389 RepID=UPI001FD64CF9|nr:choice-of-anchor J domain-containing protein [Chryseobacterium daecheongense]UOU98095.1 choice-of-anchor J domain-containing protein [Chryseobacterium daecheongense]
MKKLLFFILTLPILCFGQWTENFDAGTTIPAGWAIINNGGANGWVFGTPEAGTAQSGSNVASLTYNTTAHDDYLITKAITVTTGVSDRISFYVKSRSSTYLENYEVLLSTTNQTVAAFTTVLQTTEKAPDVWTQKTFSLSAYAGQTVYVAIHATDTDQWQLYADTFVVDSAPTTVPGCATLTAPTNTATGVNPDGVLSWNPVTSATGYKIKVGTTSGGTDILNNVDAGNVTSYNIPGTLNSGTTYYVTVTPYNGIGDATGCSQISFTTIPAPANDNCSGAIALTVNPDLNCSSVASGNTLGANQSMAAAPCSGTPDDDVWYSFVATATSHVITLSNVVSTGTTSSTDTYFQVLSGTCGNLTSVLCSDPLSGTATGLTVGQTYYVRVYSYSGEGYAQSFNICVGTLPPPPANDNCSGAIALTVNPNLNCGVTTTGNTTSATESMAATPCNGMPDDDVWYSFVATSASHVVTLSNVSASTDMYFQVLSGICGSQTSIVCSDPNSATLTGLTPGQTYYIRVYTYSNGTNASFTICIGTPPPPPANDECSGAIPLTVGTDFASGAISSTNAGATTDVTSTCASSNSVNNTWYSVVVPASGNVTLETGAVSGSQFTDSILAAYSGTCGSLTQISCNDDITTSTNLYSRVALTGRTPGETIYVSVWRYSTAGGDGPIQVSAYDSGSLATIEVAEAQNKIKAYPNPFVDVLNISEIFKVKSISVTDMAGRVLKIIDAPSSSLYLGELTSGMYLITLQMKDGSKQIIKAIKK